MGSRALTIKPHNVERLVTAFPDKAVEVLMRCCHDPELERELLQFLLDPSPGAPTTSNANHVHAPPVTKSSLGAKRIDSFSDPSQQRFRAPSRIGANTRPPSPPASRSNPRSSVSNRDGSEHVIVMEIDEDIGDVKEHLATLKRAATEYSVIGDHMFTTGRICPSKIEDIVQQEIWVPHRSAPGSTTLVPTLFYLVSQEFIGIDILLGYADSGEDPPEAMPVSPTRGAGVNTREHDSYHRSSNTNHGSTIYSRPPLNDRVMTFVNQLQEPNAARPRPGPAAPTSQRGEPSHTPRPSPADPSTSNPTPPQQSVGRDRVRLHCTLYEAKMKLWLDLDASAQEFISEVEKAFNNKRLAFVPPATTLIFEAASKDTYDISLEEDALEADWADFIEWIRSNKQAHMPMYGVFQVEND
ncbi:hypothetical protein ACEQ8H_003396 [Pleosporales sp. CAS-2024a]